MDNLVELRGVPKTFQKGANLEDENGGEEDDDDIVEVESKSVAPPKSIVGMNPFKKRKLESSTSSSDGTESSPSQSTISAFHSSTPLLKSAPRGFVKASDSSSESIKTNASLSEIPKQKFAKIQFSEPQNTNSKTNNVQKITFGTSLVPQSKEERPGFSTRPAHISSSSQSSLGTVTKKKFQPITGPEQSARDGVKRKPKRFATVLQRVVVVKNFDNVNQSLEWNQCSYDYVFEVTRNQLKCVLFVENAAVASAFGVDEKTVKLECGAKALKKFNLENIVVERLSFSNRQADVDENTITQVLDDNKVVLPGTYTIQSSGIWVFRTRNLYAEVGLLFFTKLKIFRSQHGF